MAERVLSLEREADDAEAREDDETSAAVAAAGAEIDAFLAHAVPNPNDDANNDADDNANDYRDDEDRPTTTSTIDDDG